jgi:hypothetical protein
MTEKEYLQEFTKFFLDATRRTISPQTAIDLFLSETPGRPDDGYRVVAFEVGKSLENAQARIRELEAQLADLRDFAYNRAPKLASEECNSQKEELRAQLADANARAGGLREALEMVEWVHDAYQNMCCPWCSNDQEEDGGHKPDCARQAALAPTPTEPTPEAGALDTAMAELCARLRDHFEAAGHPACPDPECDYIAYENTDHAPNCAYVKYVQAQNRAIAEPTQVSPTPAIVKTLTNQHQRPFCVYLSDGKKISIQREGGAAWLRIEDTPIVTAAEPPQVFPWKEGDMLRAELEEKK